MEAIEFKGKIGSGVGKYVELHVPGRGGLPQSPGDWPWVLCKGSLNIHVDPDGYPDLFDEIGLPRTTRSLDQKPIACSFEIGQSEFGNQQAATDGNNATEGCCTSMACEPNSK